MNAKRDDVVATLVEAGMDADNVKAWSDKEMATKIKGLPAIKDELKEPEGFPHRKLLKKLLKAAGAGDEIVIESVEANGDAESNGHAKAPAKKASKKKGNAPKGEKKTRQSRGPINRGDLDKRDKFGSPIGSSDAMVNKVLGKKPLTVSDIREKTGLPASKIRYTHLTKLIKAKHIKKDGKAFVLAK